MLTGFNVTPGSLLRAHRVHEAFDLPDVRSDDSARAADVMRDGYYHTGDVASRDADGYITYVGHADNVFKSSDYRIWPFELESILIEHEGWPRRTWCSRPAGSPTCYRGGILRFCRERMRRIAVFAC